MTAKKKPHQLLKNPGICEAKPKPDPAAEVKRIEHTEGVPECKLRTHTDLAEEIHCPFSELTMAISSGRPNLIRRWKPTQDISPEHAVHLANIIRVLLLTNQQYVSAISKLERHVERLHQLAYEAREPFGLARSRMEALLAERRTFQNPIDGLNEPDGE
jgi:hypothetical protein